MSDLVPEPDDYDDDATSNVEMNLRMRKWQLELFNRLKRFNVLVIHRGAGKTILALMVLVIRAMQGPAHAEYLYLGPLKNQMMRAMWEPLKLLLQPLVDVKAVYVNNNRLEIIFFPNRRDDGPGVRSRITVLGADEPDTLRGKHLHGLIIDEFGDCPKDTWQIVFPMVTNWHAWVIFIGTPKGRNEFYNKLMEAQRPENSDDWLGVVMDYKSTGALDPLEIEAARRTMSQDFFAQEYECNFEASNSNAYYARQIAELRVNGGIVYDRFLYDPNLEVHCCWDIGMRDYTAIWWFQVVRDHTTKEDIIHFIDFEQSANMGLPDWNMVILERERTLGYRRGSMIFPHDIKVREWGANISRIEAAEKLGIAVEQCPDHGIDDRIELMRLHLPKCKFDGRRCDEGIESLAQYREKVNKMGIGMGVPDKSNGVDHAADAAGYGMLYAKQVMGKPVMMRIPMFRRM